MYIVNSSQQKARNVLSYTSTEVQTFPKEKGTKVLSNAKAMDSVCGAHFSLHPNSRMPSCQVKGHLGT